MPRPCFICTDPRRAEIDAAVVAGESDRAIVARLGVSRGSLRAHRVNHLNLPGLPRGPQSASERELGRFVRAANRLLREQERRTEPCTACGYPGRDWRAIQGAIVAGTKAATEWGRARGEIKSVANATAVTVSVQTQQALELRERAVALEPRAVLEAAAEILRAALERRDADGLRIVRGLAAQVQAGREVEAVVLE